MFEYLWCWQPRTAHNVYVLPADVPAAHIITTTKLSLYYVWLQEVSTAIMHVFGSNLVPDLNLSTVSASGSVFKVCLSIASLTISVKDITYKHLFECGAESLRFLCMALVCTRVIAVIWNFLMIWAAIFSPSGKN